MNLIKYKNVNYDDDTYNCLHFAVDIYRDITGYDMGLYVDGLMCGKSKRKINPSKLKEFELLEQPISPCLAIMRSQVVHAGIYHNGVIIHLTESGIKAQPPHLASLQHGTISYYKIKD